MTAEKALLLVADLEEVVREHLPHDIEFIHMLASLRQALEETSLRENEGDGLVMGNAETREVRFAYGHHQFEEVEWMDDEAHKPIIVDGRKEAIGRGT